MGEEFDLRGELEQFLRTANEAAARGKYPNSMMGAFPHVAELLWNVCGCREQAARVDDARFRAAVRDEAMSLLSELSEKARCL